MTRNLIYIISQKGGLLYYSQVEGLLAELKSKNFFEKITLLSGFREGEDWEKDKFRLESKGIGLEFFRRYPNFGFYKNRQTAEFRNILKKILVDNTVIHIRGESYSPHIRKVVKKSGLNNVRIISDIRGAAYEERVIYNKHLFVMNLIKAGYYKKTLRNISINCDAISCVSESLASYVLKRSRKTEVKFYINHCVAGKNFVFSPDKRIEYRKKLGLNEEDVLFVFSTQAGSGWQNTEEINAGFKNLGFRLLHLSDGKMQGDNIISLLVPYDEMPYYLSAADIGIIWRNDDVVNNVASPIKFSEYICCGLPVIANNGVHLINDYIRTTGNGKIIDKFAEIKEDVVVTLLGINREMISSAAMKEFSVEFIAGDYLKIYEEVLGK